MTVPPMFRVVAFVPDDVLGQVTRLILTSGGAVESQDVLEESQEKKQSVRRKSASQTQGSGRLLTARRSILSMVSPEIGLASGTLVERLQNVHTAGAVYQALVKMNGKQVVRRKGLWYAKEAKQHGEAND
jgi:hypothetical protein